MTQLPVSETIVKVFSTVFHDLSKQEIEALQRDESELWDSLKHIELIAELEDYFDIEIPDKGLERIRDVSSAAQAVEDEL